MRSRPRVFCLTYYSRAGASSRVRIISYIPWFCKKGLEVLHNSLIDDDNLQARYSSGRYLFGRLLMSYARRLLLLFRLRKGDVLFVEKQIFPFIPFPVELMLKKLGVRVFLDFDDGVFLRRDSESFLTKVYRLATWMAIRNTCGVVCGNPNIRRYVRVLGAKNTILVPSVVEMACSDLDWRPPDDCRIFWIGSPSTMKHLEEVWSVLVKLVSELKVTIWIVGGGPATECIPGIKIVAWEENIENIICRTGDIGIMPLANGNWERFKCGYKIVSYMAQGMVVVASPIGVNKSLVINGETGYLASTKRSWDLSLRELIGNPERRIDLGRSGFQRVRAGFSYESQESKLSDFLFGDAL